MLKGDRTYIMGVLNVTPDSFSDGGRYLDKDAAVAHGLDMARDGADIIDVGGESTRPGAKDVSAKEELGRVIPVIEYLAKKTTVEISIDTRKAEVARLALKAGARIVNDVSGLRHDRDMAQVVAEGGAALIAMHMKGAPQDMQSSPHYDNLIKEIIDFLGCSIGMAKSAGVPEDEIIIDPGIGFGKTAEHNLEILKRLDEFKVLGCPVCVGTSRKSFIGKVLSKSCANERLFGSLATYVIAIMKGASILRVHDVKEAREAARMADSVLTKKAV